MEQLRRNVELIEQRFTLLEKNLTDNLEQLMSELHAQQSKTKLDRLWDMGTKLAVPAILMLASFIYNLANRVAYIEATRFTSIDFARSMSEIERKIIHAAQGPEWLRTDLSKIVVNIDGLKESVSRLGERVARIEAASTKR